MTAISALRVFADRLRWANPGAAPLTLSAMAWVYMAVHSAGSEHCPSDAPIGAQGVAWISMVVAMMFPLLHDPLRTVRLRSFRERRAMMAAAFLTAYTAVWATAGAPVIWLGTTTWALAPVTPAIAFLAAGAWTLSPAHRFGLRLCHAKRPLRAHGARAIADVLAYGARIGGACLLTCGPLMIACTLAQHAPVAMIGGATVGVVERFSFRDSPRRVASIVFWLAAWYGVSAMLRVGGG